mgnify:CR=1 FL=1
MDFFKTTANRSSGRSKKKGRGRSEVKAAFDTLNGSAQDCAFEDRERNLWIGTDIGGLARLGGKAVSNHGKEQGLPSACVFGITAGDTADSLWLGTQMSAKA